MSFGQGSGGFFGNRGQGNEGGSSQPPGGGFGGFFGNRSSGDDGNSGGGSGTATTQDSSGSRRPGALILTIIILAALVVLFVVFSLVYTEVLWFSQLGYTNVFWTEHITRGILFVAAGLLMGLVTWVSMQLAWKKRPKNIRGQVRDTVAQYQKQLEPIRRLIFIGVPILIGFFAGSAAMNGWQQVLLFINQEPYGKTDPQFGLDISFYLATLPFIGTLVGFLISVTLVAGIAGLLVHYLYGGFRIQENGRVIIEKAARIHIIVFASLFMLLQGVNFWLNRYRTLQDQTGEWAGAMYTDVNAVIPTSTILAIAAVLVIALFIMTAINGRWRFAITGAAAFVVAALVAGMVYPFLIQEYQVKPTERTLESEYIQRNIEMTREGYGLADMEYTDYAGETDTEAGALRGQAANTANIRLMDPNLLSRTFGQLQQFRPYYSFPDTLHLDRYEIDGETRDTVLSVREVNVNPESSWVNQHVTYTHGYGVAAADASEVAAGGRPSFLMKGIPTTGPLTEDREFEPRIYFGMNSPAYSVVGKPEGGEDKERDRPQDADSEQDTTYTFTGDGGPSVGNIFNRLAFAVKFGSTEMLLSQDVNENSQVLFNRNPIDRVRKLAPYLDVDTNAYPAIVDGRIQWIVDGYTTSNAFPYSAEQQLDSATQDALNRNEALNLTGNVNYIRNSVKATVDAYDGSVKLYAWDPKDPLLQAWQKVYGDSIRPYSEMSAELMDHVRYPEDMFKVQREIMTRYHVTDPGDFYENNDAWSVPSDPTQDNANIKQPPYYMTMQMPGKEEPAFQLTSTFIPQITEGSAQRNVLYGFLAANGDAGTGKDGEKAEDYGHLQLLELPRQTTTPGPGQAQANFDSDDTVSRELNLLRQGASDVLNGNMITLPAADGILYVQPVYVQSSGETSYPLLRKVLVAFGDKVGFADTLAEALDQVFEGDSGATTAEQGSGTTGEDVGDPDGQPQVPETKTADEQLADELKKAADAMKESETALKDGDWTAYGEAQKKLNDALNKALEFDGQDAPAEEAEQPAEDEPEE